MVEQQERLTFSTNSSEQAVVGAVFVGGERVFYEADSLGLRDEHFSQPGHRFMWRVFRDGLSRGVVPDIALIYEENEAELKRYGGWAWLNAFANKCGSLSHINNYVDRILSGHRRGKILHAARVALEVGADPSSSTADIHAALEEALKESSESIGIGTEYETAETLVMDWAARRQAVLDGEAEDLELTWDIHALDRFVAAGPGHLIVLGGRPKMGKSQLALSLMANVSKKYGPTLFCSAEMGKDALARRIISSDADIKQTDPMGFAEETAKVFREWAGVPMFFDYRARSFNNVCASIRFAHRKFGIKAAAVDYLQLLEMDGGRTEEEEIGRASKGFKNLAEDLGIPIVLLVQVNRRCEERTDKRPVMSDIRGSGRVEQDADAVVFVYREAYYNESFARPSQVELLVRANRHGPSGTGIAFWRPGGGWFRDPTPWETLGTK